MERIYATLEKNSLAEERLPSAIQNKINRIEIMTDKYNSKCDILDSIEDEESEQYKNLDNECEQLDAEIDEFEEEIVGNIEHFAAAQSQAAQSQSAQSQAQRQVHHQAQVQNQGKQDEIKKKKGDGFWILAGIIGVITLGTVVLKND
jgi:hypothetical protein